MSDTTSPVQQIVLVGLSGVGKSSVGGALAKRLGWPLIDTDDLVTAREGKTPADLIVEKGEPAFREIEQLVIAEAVKQAPAVLATGGGAFQRAANRRALGERGFICYLDATTTEIARRLRANPDGAIRPLLGDDIDARLETLNQERRPFYLHADLWVPVQGSPEAAAQTTEAAVARIIRAWVTESGAIAGNTRRLDRLGAAQPARGPAAIVDTGDQKYPIWVGTGELGRLGDRLRQIGLDGRRVFLISDDRVVEQHGQTVAQALDAAGIPGASYVIPAGEQSKTQRVAAELYAWLAAEKAERRDVIVALGGGVVCDLAAYVAATYLRGMAIVQLPTSVLAMNDAAIGGKAAVDLPQGKNLVGAFHQPAAVISDIDVLRTLPRRSYIEGFAEVIKHALILDPALLKVLEENAAGLSSTSPDWDLVTEVVARSSRLKALIVSSDPKEQGIRAILNYGHTIGHGIEQATGYRDYMHGEAVSVGMMGAAKISQAMGLIDQALVDRQGDLLRSFGLPLVAPDVNTTVIMDAMTRDKKVEQGRLRFVLLEGLGRAVVRGDVSGELVARTVASLVRG
ncbi:MAG: 3-dehydroquinate synthase [Chloroflexi bacterium]|nr:3-dehydroquinate synthase [Chloroflexota bacterium]MDA1239560.1 3-dehydroquinate synthase [Chloroflexota bacterium]MQC48240.1 3-dehydroquinate synthase [Chloroflexota bacterium]